MGLAERLPVVTLPEQHHVAAVRNDVIDNLGLGYAASPFTRRAQRVPGQEAGSGLVPLAVVATFTSAATPAVRLLLPALLRGFETLSALSLVGWAQPAGEGEFQTT